MKMTVGCSGDRPGRRRSLRQFQWARRLQYWTGGFVCLGAAYGGWIEPFLDDPYDLDTLWVEHLRVRAE